MLLPGSTFRVIGLWLYIREQLSSFFSSGKSYLNKSTDRFALHLINGSIINCSQSYRHVFYAFYLKERETLIFKLQFSIITFSLST